MRRPTKGLVAAGIVLGLLLAARAVAPVVVKRYVNDSLASMGEYRGEVAGVDLFLWRGGYALRDVTVVKVAAQGQGRDTPFVTMPRMDLTLQWRALFHGEAVGEVVMFSPVLNLVQSESDESTQLGAGVSWPEEIRDLFPFRLNSVEVQNGLVTFLAPGIQAEESLTMRDFQLLLRNLTNVSNVSDPAFADISLTGRIMGNAPLKLEGKIDPNEELPTFDIDFGLEGARLVDVNPWLREFLKVDAQDGVFAMYAELAAADGRFEGYVKPLLENPKFFDRKEQTSGPFQRAWEAIVQVAAKILENRQEEQVATRIPFSGEIENPRTGLLSAFVNLLRNAFVAAFTHSLEGSVSLKDVGGDVPCLDNDGKTDCGGKRQGPFHRNRESRKDEATSPDAPSDRRERPGREP
jgi:hypothetical protein